MNYRPFGTVGHQTSEVGLGCWQLGSECWHDMSDKTAQEIMAASVEGGVNFFDTADVYGAGGSETLIGKFLKGRSNEIFVATKLGRFSDPGWPENFQRNAMFQHAEASIRRLGVEALDLLQLHCIPREELSNGAVFDVLRELKQAGKIKAFGASVESMEEAQICLKQEGLSSLQIIFNIFRQKPIATLFDDAQKRGVAIIVRLPLASGLLTGKITAATKFAETDHRNFNRDGASFNVGETFAGLPLAKGAELAEELKALVPEGMTMAQMSLRWILDHEAVSVVIPGASSPEQARANLTASTLPPLSKDLHARLSAFYQDKVEGNIRGPY